MEQTERGKDRWLCRFFCGRNCAGDGIPWFLDLRLDPRGGSEILDGFGVDRAVR